MDPQRLFALWEARNYVLLAALVIGFVVRILKSDTKIPINIPPRLRMPLAFALGAVVGVLETIASGKAWRQAVFEGLVAAALAVLGQNALIDSLRGGKEIPIPGLMIPGEPPGPGKPPTIPPGPPPPPSGPSVMPPLMVLMLVGSFLVSGCLKAIKAAELVLDKAACVVAHQELSNQEIFVECAVQPGDIPRYLDLLSESRAATRKALERAGACK